MTISHHLSYTRAYAAWYNMQVRCTDEYSEKYPLYGARGISVCPEWDSVEQFYADMGEPGPGETLDRIDPDKNYEPNNCRWASQIVQQNNRRNNIRVTWGTETRTIAEWARELGLKYHTLYKRIVIDGRTFPDAASDLYARRAA